MDEKLIRDQDEILQILYWLRGESLEERPAIDLVRRFVQIGNSEFNLALAQLEKQEWIFLRPDPAGQLVCGLTERGLQEGKRRFVEEFSSFLGKESHLTCDDPNCDCHQEGWDGICHTA